MLKELLLVGSGSFMGGVLRYLLSCLIKFDGTHSRFTAKYAKTVRRRQYNNNTARRTNAGRFCCKLTIFSLCYFFGEYNGLFYHRYNLRNIFEKQYII